jgi:hypothetical protein
MDHTSHVLALVALAIRFCFGCLEGWIMEFLLSGTTPVSDAESE